MQTYRVADRPQSFDAIRWDASAEAADWVSARWPDDAGLSGEGDQQELVMYGAWEIPVGTFLVDRQGSFHHVPPDVVNFVYQLAAANDIPVTEMPEPPAEDPPAEEPPAETLA